MRFCHKFHANKPFACLISETVHFSKASVINVANNQGSANELEGNRRCKIVSPAIPVS
jgi:hypothetical protein